MTATMNETHPEYARPGQLRPSRASQMSFSTEFRFWISVAMCLAMYFIASSIGSGWVLFLTAGMLCACLLSLAVPFILLKAISIEVSGPELLSAGEDVNLILKPRYPSWLSPMLCWVLVKARPKSSELYGEEKIQAILLEQVKQDVSIILKCPGLKRGIRKLCPVELQTSFPFGMAWCKAIFQSQHKLCVLPKIADVEGKFLFRLASSSYVPGDAQESASGFQSCTAKGIRNYVRGDSRRYIHWSLSARHGHLIVRELENEGLPVFDLVLDFGADWSNSEQLELAITAAASILNLGHSLGIHPELFVLDTIVSIGEQLPGRSTEIDEQLIKLASLDYTRAWFREDKNAISTQVQCSDPLAFEDRQRAMILISPFSRTRSTSVLREEKGKSRNTVFVLSVGAADLDISSVSSTDFILRKPEDFSDL